MGNERSASHGLDLACRRRIGEAVQAARARGFPKEALREVAREGNAARLGEMPTRSFWRGAARMGGRPRWMCARHASWPPAPVLMAPFIRLGGT